MKKCKHPPIDVSLLGGSACPIKIEWCAWCGAYRTETSGWRKPNIVNQLHNLFKKIDD